MLCSLIAFKGETHAVSRLLQHIKQVVSFCSHLLPRRFLRGTQPAPTSLLLRTRTDLARGKAELVTENALLRQQLIIPWATDQTANVLCWLLGASVLKKGKGKDLQKAVRQ
jgi:hypothetical protein